MALKAQQCQKVLNDISTWHTVELYWVPGHVGVRGNEIAIKLAKGSSVQKLKEQGSPNLWDFGAPRACFSWSQWPHGLRHRSTAAHLLRSWFRISLGAWMSVCCERCVLSGRDLSDKLITRPEESYRLWCVDVCDLETTKILVNEEEAKAR